jgi:hypothetical protein
MGCNELGTWKVPVEQIQKVGSPRLSQAYPANGILGPYGYKDSQHAFSPGVPNGPQKYTITFSSRRTVELSGVPADTVTIRIGDAETKTETSKIRRIEFGEAATGSRPSSRAAKLTLASGKQLDAPVTTSADYVWIAGVDPDGLPVYVHWNNVVAVDIVQAAGAR